VQSVIDGAQKPEHAENKQGETTKRRNESDSHPQGNVPERRSIMSLFEFISVILTLVIACSAFATFLAVCAQAWIYNSQLKEMKRSTDAAISAAQSAKESIEHARLDQRAWVAFVGISGIPAVNETLQVSVKARNNGKTFAKNFQMYVYFLDTPAGQTPDFSEDDKPHPGSSIFVLSPNGEWGSNTNVMQGITPTGKVTQEQIDNWKSGKRTFFVCAKLTYDDIFGVHHWTTFCNQLTTDFVYRAYEQHNDADNN
jgi:type II secretory pathway pseudopilin PulG